MDFKVSLQDKMKILTLLVTVLIAETWGFVINFPTYNIKPTVQYDWIHLQKLILPLFENVCEDTRNPMIIGLEQEFSMEIKNGSFSEPSIYGEFQKLVKSGSLVPQGEIFSEYDQDHLEQFRIISELLYSVNNFNTFLKVAAWSRQNLNCGLYLDVIYLALLRRRDTEMLSVPAPYEILPNYFIRKDAIITGSSLLSGTLAATSDDVRIVGNTYVVDVNYTADFYNNDDESSLAYFHEDIGLSTYYYMSKLLKSPWLNNPLDMNSRFGEFTYHMLKQLNTRYNLERYSNGFEDVQALNWRQPVTTMYNPMLIYSNGNDFGSRTKHLDLTASADLSTLDEIENNIYQVAAHMKQSNYNRTQILNTIMEMLITGDKSYGKIAYLNAGKNAELNGWPSVLEHYMTATRDPIFWRINKKIVEIIDKTMEELQPTYDRNELFYPGVEVVNVEIKKLSTFCDYFEFDTTDALKAADSQSNFIVKMSQARLNHKSFSMKLNISSLVSQKGLVKVFLGPKMLPGEFALRKHQFMLLDSFEVMLKKGGNAITRTSDDMKYLKNDFTSLKALRKKVEDAEFGFDVMFDSKIESYADFPSRLLLPKGSDEGMPFQLFVFVAPFVKVNIGTLIVASTEFNSATLNPGYPLDCYTNDWELFSLPNSYIKEVIITHKACNKPYSSGGGVNASKKWEKPDSFDYSEKKGQFGKRPSGSFDYSNKGEQSDNIDPVSFNYNEKLQQSEKTENIINKQFSPLNNDNDKILDKNRNLQAKSKWSKYIPDTNTDKNEETVNTIPIKDVPVFLVPLDYDKNIQSIDNDNNEVLDKIQNLQSSSKWYKYIPDTDTDKNRKTVDAIPIEDVSAFSVPIDYDKNKQSFVIDSDISKGSIDKTDVGDNGNIFKSLLRLVFPENRRPTVYDYLLPDIYKYGQDEDETIKVYE